MRYTKTLGLLAVAAAAMMALAASASADYLSTSTDGGAATPSIHWVDDGNHVTIHNPQSNIECSSTSTGTPNAHGAGKSISGPHSSFTFTNCTGEWEVVANDAGKFSIDHVSGHRGTVTSSGMTITATLDLVWFHVTCRYATNNTDIGFLTGGDPALFHLEASVPFHGGSGACGSGNAVWTGDYVSTSALYVKNS